MPGVAVRVPHTAREQWNLNIVQNGEPWEQCEALEHDGHIRVQFSYWLAVPEHFARGRRCEAGENSHQRGFSRTRRSKQCDDRIGFQRQFVGAIT